MIKIKKTHTKSRTQLTTIFKIVKNIAPVNTLEFFGYIGVPLELKVYFLNAILLILIFTYHNFFTSIKITSDCENNNINMK